MSNGLKQSYLPEKSGGQVDLSNINIRLNEVEDRLNTLNQNLGVDESRQDALDNRIPTLEGLVDRAETASNTARGSATTATTKANEATTQAESAKTNADNAKQYALEAEEALEDVKAQVTIATEKAQLAGTNANNAGVSERNAKQYMEECENIKNRMLDNVDSALSTTSVFPVQNKVITNALNDKQDKLVGAKLAAVDSGITAEKLATINEAIANAQGALNPIQLSAVNSGITATKVGIYDNAVESITTLKTYFYNGIANKALADEDNNNIKTTYATKDELSTALQDKQNTLTASQLKAVNSGITAERVTRYEKLVEQAQPQIEDLEDIRQGAEDGKDAKEGLETATTDITTLKGYFNNGVANKAVADKNGNAIDETYLKKTDAENDYLSKTKAESDYFKKTVIGDISHHFYSTSNGLVESKAKVLYVDLAKYATDGNITQNILNDVLSTCIANKMRCYIPVGTYSINSAIIALGAENDLDIEGQQTIIDITNSLTVNAVSGSNIQFKGIKFNSGQLHINSCNSAIITNCTFDGRLFLQDCNNITFKHCDMKGEINIGTDVKSVTRFIVFDNCNFTYGTYSALVKAENAVVTFNDCSVDGKDMATFIKASNSDFVFNHCRADKCVKAFEAVNGAITISLNDVVLDYTGSNQLNTYALYIDSTASTDQVTLFGNLFMVGTKGGTHLAGADGNYKVVCEANIFTDNINYVVGGMDIPVKVYPLNLTGVLSASNATATNTFIVALPQFSNFRGSNIPIIVLNSLELSNTKIVNYYTKKSSNNVYVFIEVDTPVTSINVPYRIAYQSDIDLQARSLTITPSSTSSLTIVKTDSGKASINVTNEAGVHLADIDVNGTNMTLKYGNTSIVLNSNGVNIIGNFYLNGKQLGIE